VFVDQKRLAGGSHSIVGTVKVQHRCKLFPAGPLSLKLEKREDSEGRFASPFHTSIT